MINGNKLNEWLSDNEPVNIESLSKYGVKNNWSDEWEIGKYIDDEYDIETCLIFEYIYGKLYYSGGDGCRYSKTIKNTFELKLLFYALTGYELKKQIDENN